MSDINKYVEQQKQEEIKITKEPVEQKQETKELSQENFATRQKVSNSALGNTDALPKELVMSSESLEKILSETDGDEEITATKEETLNVVESTLTVPIVSENINKPSYQTSKILMDAKQGQKVKLADDTKLLGKELTEDQINRQKQEDKFLESVAAVRELLSHLRDKKYGTSDDKGTWYIIQSAGEAFLNNIETKSDKERGEDLANLLKSAQRYLGTHSGRRFTSKGKNRVAYAKSIVASVSNLLRESTKEGRVIAVDAILQKQEETEGAGSLEAKELNKEFFTDYMKEKMRKEIGEDNKAQESFITDKTFLLMHYRERNGCYFDALKKISKGKHRDTIFKRSHMISNKGKHFILNRNGDINPEDVNDAMVTEQYLEKTYHATPEEAAFISRSAFVKQLKQIKVTPDLFNKEYLLSHPLEVQEMMQNITLLQNAYTDWSAMQQDCKDAAEKEYRSLPPALAKKLNALSLVANAIANFYEDMSFKNGLYSKEAEPKFIKDDRYEEILSYKDKRKYIIDLIESEKNKTPTERWDTIDAAEFNYSVTALTLLYNPVRPDPKGEIVDVLEKGDAAIMEAKLIFEQAGGDVEITEEDIKQMQYIAYEEEAKKESERLKVEITPEAVALSKMSKLVDDFKTKEYKDPENEALKKVLPGEKFNRMYAQKIRYINYNNDGQPLTEEDRKNLEWNKAYAKAILENSQEDRIRLIKEDSEYIANLLNRVDWDRVLDFDYWNNNKDLYITLNNFVLTAMAFDPNNCLPEDAPILREHFEPKTPMMKLLKEFSDITVSMNGYFGTRGSLIRVGTQTGDYLTAQEVTDQTGIKNMESALEQDTKKQVEALKKTLADYNASRN